MHLDPFDQLLDERSTLMVGRGGPQPVDVEIPKSRHKLRIATGYLVLLELFGPFSTCSHAHSSDRFGDLTLLLAE